MGTDYVKGAKWNDPVLTFQEAQYIQGHIPMSNEAQALHKAIDVGNAALVNKLLYMVDDIKEILTEMNSVGETPMQAAMSGDHHDIVQVIKKHVQLTMEHRRYA